MTKLSEDEATAEKKLIELAQDGDEEAFAELVENYRVKVEKIIGRYVDDEAEVHDLRQEVFIRVYRALPKFRGDSSFYTWLYRVTINAAKNYLLSKSRHPPITDIDFENAELYFTNKVPHETGSPERMMISRELEDRVFDVMDKLSNDLRIAFILREVEGLSYDDIADIMDCPVGTIRSRIFRARKVINSELQKAQKK